MEELAADDTRSHHVRQRQLGGRATGIPQERPGGVEGTERVCNLLLGDLHRHANPEQEMRDVQEHVPLGVPVPVVQEQQPEYMSVVPQQLRVCISGWDSLWDIHR